MSHIHLLHRSPNHLCQRLTATRWLGKSVSALVPLLVPMALSLFLGAEAGAAVPSRVLSVPVMRNPAPLTPSLRLAEQGQGGVSAHAWAVKLEAPSSIGEGQAADAPGDPEQEALSLYQRGLLLLKSGKLAEAAAVYDQVLQAFPGTRAASRATLMLLELRQDGSSQAPAAGPEQGSASPTGAQAGTVESGASTDRERLSGQGRVEFLANESLLGLYAAHLLSTGLSLPEKMELVMPVLGLGVGLGASWLISNNVPVSSAEAARLRSVQLLTMYNVAMWSNLLEYPSLPTNDVDALNQLLGLGLGTGLGIAAHRWLPMSEGEVAFTTSVGVWAPLLTVLLEGAIIADPQTQPVETQRLQYSLLPIAADVGVAGAVLLSRLGCVKVSRDRMTLINLSGGLGLLLVVPFVGPVFAQSAAAEFWESIGLGGPNSVDLRGPIAMLLSGALFGLAVGVGATSQWDLPESSKALARSDSPSLLTVEEGMLKLGRFAPVLRPEVRVTRGEEGSHREQGTLVSLGLLGGTF